MKKLFIFIDTCLVMATILTVTTVVPDSKSVSVKRLDTFVNSSIITKEIKEDTQEITLNLPSIGFTFITVSIFPSI